MGNIIFIIFLAIFLITFLIFYNNYSRFKKESTKEKTGYDAALEVTRKYDIDSYIIEKRGNFTDNYNYNKKVIKLSSLVFHDNNNYSVAMGYFIAMQAVLDKEDNKLFKIKKLLEPVYNFLITISYISILLLAFSNLNIMYATTFLGLCLIYQLVFLKTNLIIIDRVKKEFEVNKEAIENLYLIDLAFGILYIRVLIDYLIDLIKRR